MQALFGLTSPIDTCFWQHSHTPNFLFFWETTPIHWQIATHRPKAGQFSVAAVDLV